MIEPTEKGRGNKLFNKLSYSLEDTSRDACPSVMFLELLRSEQDGYCKLSFNVKVSRPEPWPRLPWDPALDTSSLSKL